MLIGNLGRDPEVRFTPAGQAIASFTLATSDNWTDKSGQKQERTEWHRIKAFGKTAELCRDYLAKGRQVYIEGRIQTNEWNDKDGNKRTTTEVVANQVLFLGGARGGGGAASAGGTGAMGGAGASEPAGEPPLEDDDIPF